MQDYDSADEYSEIEDEGHSVICSTIITETKFLCNEPTVKMFDPPKPRIHSLKIIRNKNKNGYPRKDVMLHVYPDGNEIENKGYVSIEVSISAEYILVEGTFIISVVNSLGEQKFSKTFKIPHPSVSKFVIEKYVSRNLLLCEPEELVPNGLLKLMVYMQITVCPEEFSSRSLYSWMDHRRYHVVPKRFKGRGLSVKLCLECPLAKRLAEESSFFQAILRTPMMENRTKVVSLPDRTAFIYIPRLVMGTSFIKFNRFDDIFSVYLAADKYDIPSVRETCICFLKLYASIHGMEKLFYFPKRIKKEKRKLLKTQIILISKSSFANEIVQTDTEVRLKEAVFNYKWIYRYSEKRKDGKIVFINLETVSSKFRKRKVDMCQETDEYDFYK